MFNINRRDVFVDAYRELEKKKLYPDSPEYLGKFLFLEQDNVKTDREIFIDFLKKYFIVGSVVKTKADKEYTVKRVFIKKKWKRDVVFLTVERLGEEYTMESFYFTLVRSPS